MISVSLLQGFEERKTKTLQELNDHFTTLPPDAAERLLKKVKELFNETNQTALFPKLDRGRKRERIPSVFPRITRKRAKIIQPVSKSLHQELISECVSSSLDSNCWMYCISLNIETILREVQDLVEKEVFVSKYEAAKMIWKCHYCKISTDLQKNMSGFVRCDKCENWIHCSCTEFNSLDEVDSGLWFCKNCN